MAAIRDVLLGINAETLRRHRSTGSALSSSERLVFIALLVLADERAIVDPGEYGASAIARLATAANLGRITVTRCLVRLEELGLISSERRTRSDGGTAPVSFRILVVGSAQGS